MKAISSGILRVDSLSMTHSPYKKFMPSLDGKHLIFGNRKKPVCQTRESLSLQAPGRGLHRSSSSLKHLFPLPVTRCSDLLYDCMISYFQVKIIECD